MPTVPVEYLSYLQYLAPPLIGAVIGYVTNRVAIRMLFRPLYPWKIFGFRVPMTPGVIPAKRHELAGNMGEVVGDHLLTADEIEKALARQAFQKRLGQIIEDRLKAIVDRDLGTIGSLVPANFKIYFDISQKAMRYRLKQELQAILRRPNTQELLGKFFQDKMDAMMEMPLAEIIPMESCGELGAIQATYQRLIASDKTKKDLEKFIEEWISTAAKQGVSIAETIPGPLVTGGLQILEKGIPALQQQLAEMVDDPLVKEQVVAGAVSGVDTFIDSLGNMAEMVRGFLHKEMVEEEIGKYLDTKKDSIASWLQSEEIRSKINGALQSQAESLLSLHFDDIWDISDPGQIKKSAEKATALIVEILRHKKTAETICHTLADIVKGDQKSLGSLLSDLLGEQGRDELLASFAEKGLESIYQEQSLQAVDSLVDSLFDKLLELRLGKLSRFIPAGVQKGVASGVQQLASNMLASEVPGLVDSLNIRKIIQEKIDSLDLLKLEDLLLSIMQEQFKYINIFGALLGFVIGCLNLGFFIL